VYVPIYRTARRQYQARDEFLGITALIRPINADIFALNSLSFQLGRED
jgi:hypothetical protein